MTVDNNKVVALSYTLVVDGEEKDKATAENPLEFIFGMGYLLPKFEANVKGKAVGDKFEFTLTPEEGYGLSDPNAIVELPISIFEENGEVRKDLLVLGRTLPMMTQQGGVVQGKIVEIGEMSIKMDFNHELADKTLNFSGKIVSVREATEKELSEGLHGERKQCGGNCSSCGGGCSGGCD